MMNIWRDGYESTVWIVENAPGWWSQFLATKSTWIPIINIINKIIESMENWTTEWWPIHTDTEVG